MKLAHEIRNPKPEEPHVKAPSGSRTTFRGTIVSVNVYNGDWGPSTKITVKVNTPDGTWLAWGTAPAAICNGDSLKGREVEITATLKPGRESHFALMSRPNGRLIA